MTDPVIIDYRTDELPEQVGVDGVTYELKETHQSRWMNALTKEMQSHASHPKEIRHLLHKASELFLALYTIAPHLGTEDVNAVPTFQKQLAASIHAMVDLAKAAQKGIQSPFMYGEADNYTPTEGDYPSDRTT